MKKRNYSCMGWPGPTSIFCPRFLRVIPILISIIFLGCTVSDSGHLYAPSVRVSCEASYNDWIEREAAKNNSMELNYNGDIHIPTAQRAAQFVSETIKYKTDFEVWGVPEYWQTSWQTHFLGTGDCEDRAWYAVKLMIDNGIPSAYTGCLFMLVWDVDRSKYAGHMVAFIMLDGEMFILDCGVLFQASQIKNMIPCAIMNYYNYQWIMRKEDEKYIYTDERSTDDTEITERLRAFKVSLQNWVGELGL